MFFLPMNFKLFVILFLVLYGLGAPGYHSYSSTDCKRSIRREGLCPQILGIVTMATNIGGAFGGTIATKIYDVTGSYAKISLTANLRNILRRTSS